jgi:hypothetical protein
LEAHSSFPVWKCGHVYGEPEQCSTFISKTGDVPFSR